MISVAQAQYGDCLRYSPKEAFDKADLVFVGTAMEPAKVPGEYVSDSETSIGFTIGYLMKIETVFKGDVKDEITIFTTTVYSPIGFVPEVPEKDRPRFLVFANRNSGVRKDYFTSSCSGSGELSLVSEYLKYLKRMKK
jgi:hypothetical protein